MKWIKIKGARQHNLKNIDLDLPRNKLVVVSGVSGSGKSSLVFDTLYQESRWRFLETLPTYVLQFMERIPRPDVDELSGLSPAVAVEQRNPVNTSRSTVGTITEIYDYLRLIYARAGETICPGCGRTVQPDSPETVTEKLFSGHESSQATVSFEPAHSDIITAQTLRESLLALGFIRLINAHSGEILRLNDQNAASRLDLSAPLQVVVDRVKIEPRNRSRLAESLAVAFSHGEGVLRVLIGGLDEPLMFSQRYHCAPCERYFPEPTPNLFSFNNPYGACATCRGFGNLLDYDLRLIVPDEGRTLAGGALDPWTKPRYEGRRARLRALCNEKGIDMHTPWRDLPQHDRDFLLHGDSWFEGLLTFLRRLERKKYKQYIRFFLRSYQSEHTCPDCGGSRLRSEAHDVVMAGETISNLAEVSIEKLREHFEVLDKKLSSNRLEAFSELIDEINSRLDFMLEVGLGYLTLSRLTRTLSGGEYQRIMLTRLLGSGLTDTLFVLDEPTIGLHQRDTRQLVTVLRNLVSRGNSLIVVEHDREVIGSADHIVELGPGSGQQGGRVLFSGQVKKFLSTQSATACYLRNPEIEKKGEVRSARKYIILRGASLHNLKKMETKFGIGLFNCVTGVSGSGKSSLVMEVLKPSVEAVLSGSGRLAQELEKVTVKNCENFDGVVLVDQSPIGKTPRSNPITYIKAFDHVRKLFASTSTAKRLGLAPSDFSFNTPGGRCEVCKGAGFELLDMQFMADVMVPCEACGGKRFTASTLSVPYQGKTIDQVLELSVNEAIAFFSDQAGIGKPLWVLQSVGLGYLKLGQSATTLSGGESQRLKIARQLIEGGSGRAHRGKLYILDEPTTGLHAVEVKKLLRVLDRLLEAGNTVIVVEHHPEVIAHADWVVDLGPEGGDAGGKVMVQGPPETVAACKKSYTGAMLARMPAFKPARDSR